MNQLIKWNYLFQKIEFSKFKQVLLNLLSNSVKYMKSQGHVQIDAALDDGGDLVLSIRDTGIGIPPEQIDKVLEPFEQVSDHLTWANEGTGLGLPIARGLIQLHGGELVLSSELGVGTTAFLRLPSYRIHRVASSLAWWRTPWGCLPVFAATSRRQRQTCLQQENTWTVATFMGGASCI
jgi:signal transduction histidine kinase